MRGIDIIDYLLDLDPVLEATYRLYHEVRYSIQDKDFPLLKRVLNEPNNLVTDYMKTSIRTIKKYIDYVGNVFDYGYTNGILEGIINKIKVIKRITFGYRSFYHFKNRILITQNLAKLKTA